MLLFEISLETNDTGLQVSLKFDTASFKSRFQESSFSRKTAPPVYVWEKSFANDVAAYLQKHRWGNFRQGK